MSVPAAPPRRRKLGLLAVVVAWSVTGLVGCTRSTGPTVVPVQETPPTSATLLSYRFELDSAGVDGRHELVSAVPVGRVAAVVVSLSSQGEEIDVELDAEVVRADADGSSQDVELRVTGVRSNDPETVEGLRPILGASSLLRRDERLAVVEQVLDVPDGLGFRADAIARQALRAPFALVGPLPLQPVGTGASWTVVAITEGEPDQVTEVVLDGSSADGYELSFELADGSVEVVGIRGALLPERQDIVLDDALVTITAMRAN